MVAGYSGTPLAKKLGIKPASRVYLVNAPQEYHEWVSPLPDDVTFARRLDRPVDLIHVFTDRAGDLAARLRALRAKIPNDGVIWVSWPKKAAKVPTDVTEDVVRAAALPLGLVDVKVCAVSEVWSGLKLVVRREHRRGG